ncbi:hypothetical protein EV580_5610 [Mycobacterium sp. BK086]|nr:hypothetical protein EV580_5610 [Mycobacterium sp. BK086]
MRRAGKAVHHWSSSRSARSVTAVVAIVIVVVAVLAGRAACSSPAHDWLANPFAAESPWRTAIPQDAGVDPNSAAMIGYVQSTRGVFANIVEFGIPIFSVGPDTPAYAVKCSGPEWGVCPFAGWPVPIPYGAKPNSGSDGVMVTVDEATSTIFEFWQAAKSGNDWSAQWGAVNSLRGSGWGGSATGSGASRLGGVIRVAEISSGVIPHALALQTSNACKTFRPPALKSDGKSARADCLPEGAHLQLDPSVDLTKLGLTKGELAVATAMQRYGGYIVDVGGAPLSMSFEFEASASPPALGKTYQAAGFRWDYDPMERIPWEKLRVLS